MTSAHHRWKNSSTEREPNQCPPQGSSLLRDNVDGPMSPIDTQNFESEPGVPACFSWCNPTRTHLRLWQKRSWESRLLQTL